MRVHCLIPSLKRLKQQNNKFVPNRASQQNSARWGVAGVWMTRRSNYFWMPVNLMLVQEMEISHKLKKRGSSCLTAKGLCQNQRIIIVSWHVHTCTPLQFRVSGNTQGVGPVRGNNSTIQNWISYAAKRSMDWLPASPISPLWVSSCFSLLPLSHFSFLSPPSY